jgi:hypothetical protein
MRREQTTHTRTTGKIIKYEKAPINTIYHNIYTIHTYQLATQNKNP